MVLCPFLGYQYGTELRILQDGDFARRKIRSVYYKFRNTSCGHRHIAQGQARVHIEIKHPIWVDVTVRQWVQRRHIAGRHFRPPRLVSQNILDHELKSQQIAECEAGDTLAVGINKLAINLQIGLVMQNTFDRRECREAASTLHPWVGRTALQVAARSE